MCVSVEVLMCKLCVCIYKYMYMYVYVPVHVYVCACDHIAHVWHFVCNCLAT